MNKIPRCTSANCADARCSMSGFMSDARCIDGTTLSITGSETALSTLFELRNGMSEAGSVTARACAACGGLCER
jgi:hypothetical protein